MDLVRFARQTVSTRLDGSCLYIAFQTGRLCSDACRCPSGIQPRHGRYALGDINNAITELEKLEYPTPTRMAQEKNLPVEAKMFNHGGRRKTVKK